MKSTVSLQVDTGLLQLIGPGGGNCFRWRRMTVGAR